MKIKIICLVSIFLLTILTLGAVSAAEDANLTASDAGEDTIVESPIEDVELDDSDLGANDDSALSANPDLNVELESNVGEYNGHFTVKVTRSSEYVCDFDDLIAYMDKNNDEWENTHTIYPDTPQNFEFKIAVGEAEKGQHTIYVEHRDNGLLIKKYTFPVTVDGFYMGVYAEEDAEWGNDIPIHFNMPRTSEGTIEFTFNGKNYIVRSDDYKREEGYNEEFFDYEDWLDRVGSKYNAVIKKEDVICGVNNIVAKYTPASKYSQFKEKTINTNMTILSKIHFSTDSVDYDGEDTISLSLPSDATGKLLVSIGGNDYTVNSDKGIYVFRYPPLDLGEYDIMVKYLGDDYEVDYGTSEFDGKHYTNVTDGITMRPYLNVTGMLWDRNKLDISLIMPSKYNGKVTFFRDTYDENPIVLGTATIKDGRATASFKVAPGSNEISAHVECGDYTGESNVKNVEVVYESSKWDADSLDVQNMIQKGNHEFLAQLKGLPEHLILDENFILKIDGREFADYEIDGYSVEGEIYINSSKLNYGKHSFELTFLGDGYFEPKTISGNFDVGNATVHIPKVTEVDSWADIDVRIPIDATGRVFFYVNGKQRDYFDLNEVYKDDDDKYVDFEFDFRDFEPKVGIYNISIIKSSGNYKFRADGTINNSYVLKSDQSVIYGGDNLRIYSPLDDYYDEFDHGSVHVEIDGVPYKISNGDAYSDYHTHIKLPSTLALGTHNITISYSGDKLRPARTVKSTFEVVPTVIYNGCINYGEGISLTMPNDAKGNLVVLLDNKLYKSVKAKGQVFISTEDVPFGYHRLDVMYDGDDYYVRTNKPGSVTFTKFSVPKTIFFKGDDAVSIALPSDVSGVLSIDYPDSNWDRHTVEKRLVNGKASIPLSMLPYGSNTIIVKLDYVDYIDEDYESTDDYDCYFEINVIRPIVTSGSSVLHSADYKIKIQDINGKPVANANVAVYFNGKKVKTVKTDSKGYAYYKVAQAPKTYTVKLVYGKHSSSFKLKVTHVVSLKAATVKKSAKKLVLTATLKKVNGKYLKNKKLTFKFNGKKYTAKTNSKGVAKLTIKSNILKKLKVGKKITYQVTYGKDTIKKTAKVKK